MFLTTPSYSLNLFDFQKQETPLSTDGHRDSFDKLYLTTEVEEGAGEGGQPELHPKLLFIVFVAAVSEAHTNAVKFVANHDPLLLPVFQLSIVTHENVERPVGIGEETE